MDDATISVLSAAVIDQSLSQMNSVHPNLYLGNEDALYKERQEQSDAQGLGTKGATAIYRKRHPKVPAFKGLQTIAAIWES